VGLPGFLPRRRSLPPHHFLPLARLCPGTLPLQRLRFSLHSLPVLHFLRSLLFLHLLRALRALHLFHDRDHRDDHSS